HGDVGLWVAASTIIVVFTIVAASLIATTSSIVAAASSIAATSSIVVASSIGATSSIVAAASSNSLLAQYDGNRFFTVVNGAWKATPLLLPVPVIELSDIAFAVDFIPAVFGVTRDPFIVFFI
ncbi:uncharacterized protein LOC111897734, partial [Lactuca sativa]|uniref:uncharacterized protein LOC111897734 n=1 Tax=Lactuca sativa TaxID=4236 RepID=UPI0022AFDD9A